MCLQLWMILMRLNRQSHCVIIFLFPFCLLYLNKRDIINTCSIDPMISILVTSSYIRDPLSWGNACARILYALVQLHKPGSARPEVRGTAEPHGGAYPP